MLIKIHCGRVWWKAHQSSRTCTAAPRQSRLWQEWTPEGRRYGSHSCSTPAPFLPEDRLCAESPPSTWLSPGGSQYGWITSGDVLAQHLNPSTEMYTCIQQTRCWILPPRCVSAAITEPFLACVTVNHTSWIVNSAVTAKGESVCGKALYHKIVEYAWRKTSY